MKQIFTFFLFLLALSVSAQNPVVKGNVRDEAGLPLPGVNVKVIATGAGTVTDIDGNFAVNATAGQDIEFSFIGYATKTVKASAATNVVLAEESSTLKEVVVVGYGTKKLGAITGSVSQVKSAEIIKTPAQSPIQAIQGKAAGVNIVTNDEPGGNPTIRVRGLGTLIGGRDPLYIIDGLESSGMNGLSQNDIENIDILKDASSLAIYGQKGANGVVIITTKKGKEGKAKVTFDSFYGVKSVQKKVDMADSYRFAYYANTVMGSSSFFDQNQNYNTDWFDEITQTGQVINNAMSISGGSENSSYYFSASNYQEKGILSGSDYERTNISSRNEYRLFDNRFKVSQNMNVSVGQATTKPLSAFTNAYKQAPNVPVMFENGRWGQPLRNPATGQVTIDGSDRFNNVANPVAQLANTNDANRNVRLFGSVAAELKLFKDLKITSSFGADYNTYRSYSFVDNQANYLTTNTTQDVTGFENSWGVNPVVYNTLTQTKGHEFKWNWDNYLTFDKDFGKHHLTVVAGVSRTTKNDDDYLSATRRNLPSQSQYWSMDLSTYEFDTAPDAVVSGLKSTPIVSLAYFGRLEYSYADKYLFNAVIRREGISAFQTQKRWDVFPSVSAGWVVSNEDFMKDSKVINYLKIRGGYGEVGNGNTTNAVNQVVFSSDYGYAFSTDQAIYPGSTIPYAVDQNLTWETMKELDFGIDFRTFNNRLSVTIDAYDRTQSKVILPVNPPSVISPQAVTVNAGEVNNKGIEATLRWEERLSDKVRYWVGGNFSYNKNELTKVSNSFFADYIGGSLGNGGYTKQVLVGESLGTFYVYEVTGYNSDGGFTYSSERKAVGSYLPTYTYGMQIGMEYHGFDISADLYGVGGNKVFNGKKAQRFGGENIEYAYLDDFWTPSNPTAENPRPSNDIPVASTYFIEDGSFLRINNITLGYTFDQFSETFSKMRLYVTAVNPFIFTKYSGYSPELSGSSNGDPLGSAGIELDAYPTNKTFSVGVNLSF